MDSPLHLFLQRCRADFASNDEGALADYIPELAKANPDHFGVSLTTPDGHVYAAGDCDVAFTIQSISKAFVFALAIDALGAERVEARIGVEPSGEAFNSIRLRADNRPFNPMVNAGAIACSGLICEAHAGGAFEAIHEAMNRCAGRTLAIDDAVFTSERATGDRNRAIAWLLRNYAILQRDVDEVLAVYFRQCSILVTARDLAVMAATIANNGVNPVSGERIFSPYAVARTLSVMTSSGMYDYAGEWIYRVGMPAKSGVGGGIIASLPGQFGLGVFSPRLDSHGNSVRGLQMCEAISARFSLHMLSRSGDMTNCVMADYDLSRTASRRGRQAQELAILEQHLDEVRVLELTGALTFASLDYVTRRVDAPASRAQFVILDLRRVPSVSSAAGLLLCELLAQLETQGVTTILAGVRDELSLPPVLQNRAAKLRRFASLDEAMEWAEDQIIYRYGGFSRLMETAPLAEQPLLAGLSAEEIAELTRLGVGRNYHTGQKILSSGETADSVFFLESGMVSVKLASGARLASLVAGLAFGEMALIERVRSADVWADTATQCVELSLSAYAEFRASNPFAGERIMRNLAVLLAKRLIQANARIDRLAGHGV